MSVCCFCLSFQIRKRSVWSSPSLDKFLVLFLYCFTIQVVEWINHNFDARQLLVQGTLKSIRKCSTEPNSDEDRSIEVIGAAKALQKLCQDPVLMKDFVDEVKQSCPELVKDIPDFALALDALAYIPFDRFVNPKDVLTFVNALIESGMATQVERGLLFVLGNTGVQRCLFILQKLPYCY